MPIYLFLCRRVGCEMYGFVMLWTFHDLSVTSLITVCTMSMTIHFFSPEKKSIIQLFLFQCFLHHLETTRPTLGYHQSQAKIDI